MANPLGKEDGLFEPKRYHGRYRGKVTDVDDPERLGRIRCIVPEILGWDSANGGPIETDWAWPAPLYGGGPEYGSFSVPPKDSYVYVEFESGDVNRPLWTGTWWGHPRKNFDEEKERPPEPPQLTRDDKQTCWKNDDSVQDPPKGEDQWVNANNESICQPLSPLWTTPPKYPFNQVFKTKENGLIVEIDDTPEAGRFHLWHGPSKSWAEMFVDPQNPGNLSVRINGRQYWLVEADDDRHVRGNMNHYVQGVKTTRLDNDRFDRMFGSWTSILEQDRKWWVGEDEEYVNLGPYTRWFEEDRTEVVRGDYILGVEGDFTILVGKGMRIEASGAVRRASATSIEDMAPRIDHNEGGINGQGIPDTPKAPDFDPNPHCDKPNLDKKCKSPPP